jgi:hypothetical protein
MEKCSIKALFTLWVGCLSSSTLQAEEVTVISQPSKCVSLKQGNICYQDISIQWHAPHASDYCLFQQQKTEPLKCWQGVNQGIYNFEFSSAQTQQYVIRQQGENEDLGHAVIEVKWVYKERRNQFGWRVF